MSSALLSDSFYPTVSTSVFALALGSGPVCMFCLMNYHNNSSKFADKSIFNNVLKVVQLQFFINQRYNANTANQ